MKVLIETKELSDTIIEIIQNATEKVFLVTPYLQLTGKKEEQWPELIDALKGAQSRRIEIHTIFRKNQTKDPVKELKSVLTENNLNIFLINDLHAKIYANESQVLITSMNLFAHSYVANYEIGICLNQKEDQSFGKIFSYIEKLKRKGVLPPKTDEKDENNRSDLTDITNKKLLSDWILKNIPQKKKNIPILQLVDVFPGISKLELIKHIIHFSEENNHYFYVQDDECLDYVENVGYCIVCQRKIESDPDLKLVRCLSCYEIDTRSGKYCHRCGKDAQTYPNRPLCKSCGALPNNSMSDNANLKQSQAHCIECGNSIIFDEELIKVRCKTCWSNNRSEFVKGKRCYICGKEFETNTKKPVCLSCYNTKLV